MDKTSELAVFGIESPIGHWSVTTTAQDAASVVSIDLHGDTPPVGLRMEPESKLEQRLACMLSRYFKGQEVDFRSVPVLLPDAPFMSSVLNALREVPYGEVRSYQWLAERIGNLKAARAVGGALGRNPIPILVPCHRIITKEGFLGGFMRGASGGSSTKGFLLELEGVRFSGNGTLLPAPEKAEGLLPVVL